MEAAHFELTEESQRACTGEKVFRIRAIRDIPERYVKAGDLGGWVSSVYASTSELRIGPHAWVADDAIVAGDARICDDALVHGVAQISGRAVIAGHARVYGWAEVDADARVKEYARVFGFANVTDNATISGRAKISGNSWLRDTATIAVVAEVRDSWVQDTSQIHNAEVRGATIEGASTVRANLPYGALVIDAEILAPHHCDVFSSTYFVTMFRHAKNRVELAILDPDRKYLGADEATLLALMPDAETAEEMRQLVAGARRRILGEHTPAAEPNPGNSMCDEPLITASATINGDIEVAEESTIARARLSGTGKISGVVKERISLEVSGEMTDLFVVEKEDYREFSSVHGTIRMIRRRYGYYLQRKENGWEQINADELGETEEQ